MEVNKRQTFKKIQSLDRNSNQQLLKYAVGYTDSSKCTREFTNVLQEIL